MQTWLATYYDGNQVKVGLIDNVRSDDLGDHLTLLCDAHDWDFHSLVELHHDHTDSNNVDWVAQVVVDGQMMSVRELPVLN